MYEKVDLDELNLAYAISIHKSQGSEYKVVILPIFRSYSIMLKRKLLYTAITRAKEKLILIGDISALKYGVERTEASRQSVLKELIIDKILSSDKPDIKKTVVKREKINDSSIPFEYLGEEINEKLEEGPQLVE